VSLAKATLQPLRAERGATPNGPAVPVQFNPSSLRLQLSNAVEGGRMQTRQAEQYLGSSTASLSLELHFDTADVGTTEAPVNVRTRTAEVAKFVLPRGSGDKQAPPRVRFQWGDLIFDGVMTSLSEDLDYFSAGGVPLRAKVSVSIQGQDARFESLAAGPGAARGAGASAPGAGGGGPGLELGAGLGRALGAGIAVGFGAERSVGFGAGLSIGTALAGESPPAFAARNGRDPEAWRGLATPGGLGPALPAGAEVALPPAGAGAPGVGAAAGAGAPAQAELAARADGPVPPAAPAERAALGRALAATGGLDAAARGAGAARAARASERARAAFGLAAGPSPAPGDERGSSYGSGVPLRPRIGLVDRRPRLARRAPRPGPAPPAPPAGAAASGCGCGSRP